MAGGCRALRWLASYRIRLVCMCLYASQILGRRSFALSVASLLSTGMLSRGEIGTLSTVWRLSVAVSKVLATFLVDQYDSRTMMAMAWTGSGICCIMFGCANGFWLMAVAWACDAAFVSFGWPAVVKQLRSWCGDNELGSWLSVFGASASLAASLAPVLFIAVVSKLELAASMQWRYAFILPGIMSVLAGLGALRTGQRTDASRAGGKQGKLEASSLSDS